MRKTCKLLLAAALLMPPAGGMADEPDPRSPLERRFLGVPAQLTEGMTKAGEGYVSPDGRRLAYQAVPAGYPFYQIYVQDLDPRSLRPMPPRRVSPGRGRTTCAWFSPDGRRLLFASSHLDPNLEATEAAARRQAEDDARSGRRRRYQWDFDPAMDLFVATLDGPATSLERLTATPGYDAECSFSPDGRRVLFVSDRDGDPDIYSMAVDGSDLRRLTAAAGYDGGPFYSPDGRWIAYRTDRAEKDMLQIHVMKADGSMDTPLTSGKGVRWAPFWHPTRPWLVWSGADHSDATQRPNYDLWIARFRATDDGFSIATPLRLTDHPGADVLPAFSPDGGLLVWTAGRGGDSGGRGAASQIWASRLDLDALEAALAAEPTP
jgi:Tol biopolymer transport system component